MRTVVCAFAAAPVALGLALSATAGSPFLMLRLRSVETDTPQAWAETRQALAENPGCCDEVWFSTGISYPPLSAHRAAAARQAAAAADCRRLGIAPGLQIQATLGHSDDITAGGGDTSAKDWTGWTGAQGVEDKYCSCPRDPKFIAYFEEVARIYAAYRPSSVWIDDDLRIGNHRPATDGSPDGCWCARCVADFSRTEGCAYTRERLRAAVKTDKALTARWERFQYGSLAEVARRIARAVVSVSPETRLGYQHALRADGQQRQVFDALHEASGHAVRSRPGGGAYYDHDPHDQVDKAYLMMAQRASLAGAKAIDSYCPEIETCPRTFACRTPRGVLLEAVENLALGMDSLSLLITDTRFERMSWYGRTFFKALAENRPCLKAFAERSAGTEPAGLFIDLVSPKGAVNAVGWRESCSGIPLVLGIGRPTGRYDALVRLLGGRLNVTTASSGEIVRRAHLADKVAGGTLPVVLEDPFVGLVVPRLTPTGELRTVAVVNATIGRTAPTRLRLRGVSGSVRSISWWALDERPVPAPYAREGQDTIVTLPPMEVWSAGWLNLQAKD